MNTDQARYKVLEGALSSADTAAFRRVVERCCSSRVKTGRSSRRTLLSNFVGPWVMNHAPRLRSLADEILAERWKFSETILNTVLPGMPADDWHVDHPYYENPAWADLPAAKAVQIVLPLVDFNARNGATELRASATPGHPTTVVLFDGRPGDALVMEARVEHRSRRNNTDQPRSAVLINLVKEGISPFAMDAETSPGWP